MMHPSHLLLVAALASVSQAAETPGENLYWPGTFTKHPYGGIYSNNINLTLSPAENHSAGGGQSWELRKGYQHLELLVTGHSRYLVSFWAKGGHAQELLIKVIAPTPGEPSKPREIPTVVPLAAGNDWRRYEQVITTSTPFPGPRLTEILLTAYSAETTSVFLDDLAIQPLATDMPEPPAIAWTATHVDLALSTPGWLNEQRGPLPTSAFVGLVDGRTSLRLGSPTNPAAPVSTVTHTCSTAGLAGKRVRLSASCAFLNDELPIQPWNGVVFVLSDPASETPLKQSPDPLWSTWSAAPPVGTYRTIEAVYELPSTATQLQLRIVGQVGLGTNVASITDVRLEVAPQ